MQSINEKESIMKNTLLFITILISALIGVNSHANNIVNGQIQLYQQQGATPADPDRGEILWRSKQGQRSCTSCHGTSPRQMGKHQKTGKAIQPMAVSVNPERYRNEKKIRKWLLRNCKWTFARECSAQEKSDILTWLIQQ
jgi:hypothetical protein